MQENANLLEVKNPKITPEFTIRITLGFLSTIIGAIVIATLFVYNLRSDVILLLKTVSTQQEMLASNQTTIIDMRIAMSQLKDQLSNFQSLYEYDRNRKLQK